LIRGKNLLTEFADKKIEDIDKALDAIKSSNEFFCAMLKSFKENKIKINLLELKGINREVNYAESMDASLGYENQQKQSNMINMVYENYKDTPELADKLTGELVDIFDGKGEHRTSFDMLKNNDEILAFCRYEEIGKNKLYFGSFNVKNNMRGLLVGDSFCKVTLEEKAKTNEINAVCNANSRIGAYYIENGFIAEKFTPDYYGIPILTIRRDDLHMSNEYKTKSMSLEDLKQLKDGNEKIEIYSAEKQEDLTDELEKVNHGYVLTRYFKDSEAKKWYLVLEKVNLSSQG